MIASGWKDYEIIGSGGGEKLERWKDVYLLRPDPQVIWQPEFELKSYPKLHARYARSESGGGAWERLKKFPDEWTVSYKDLTFSVKPMGFKHTGLFPEQAANWDAMRAIIAASGRERPSVLNLFGYTGGATVALAKEGAFVTHVDAAKGMVDRCRVNAELCGLKDDAVRYIVDDCGKFVAREIKRGRKYDAVIMDPPSYGRGPSGETWKIEDGLFELMKQVKNVLCDEPLFMLVNSYTTGLQPTVLDNMLSIIMGGGEHTAYELGLPTSDGRGVILPCGASGLWQKTKDKKENEKQWTSR